MHNYRICVGNTDKDSYLMLQVQAPSFSEACTAVEVDLERSQYIVSCVRNAAEEAPINDPFLAALLLEEMLDALDHLVKTGYDTSTISAVLAGYGEEASEEMH